MLLSLILFTLAMCFFNFKQRSNLDPWSKVKNTSFFLFMNRQFLFFPRFINLNNYLLLFENIRIFCKNSSANYFLYCMYEYKNSRNSFRTIRITHSALHDIFFILIVLLWTVLEIFQNIELKKMYLIAQHYIPLTKTRSLSLCHNEVIIHETDCRLYKNIIKPFNNLCQYFLQPQNNWSRSGQLFKNKGQLRKYGHMYKRIQNIILQMWMLKEKLVRRLMLDILN